MDFFIENKNKEKIWLQAKSLLDALKKNGHINIDEWYHFILFVRKKLNLPICENVLTLSQK